MPTWFGADELRQLVEVGIIPRPGTPLVAPEGWNCYEIAMSPVDLSSTFLRETSLDVNGLKLFMPDEVIAIYQGATE